MLEKFYLNGKLKVYGTTFEKEPAEAVIIPCRDGITKGNFNLMEGDVFKVAQADWVNTIGYENTKCDIDCFVRSSDGFGGQNIRCIKDGRYTVTVNTTEEISIEYIGEPDENELSAWEVAGDMVNHPDKWGIGPDKIYLKNISKEKLPLECSYYDFNCYCNPEPLALEPGDQLKLAALNDTLWVKVAGKSLLRDHGQNTTFGDDSFIGDGDEAYGPNILIKHSGKYVFYLCISKADPENFEIHWECL